APVRVLLGPAAADLLALQPLPAAEAALEEGHVGGDLHIGAAADEAGGLAGALERGGDDDVRRIGGDGRGERFGLADAGGVQRDVDLALQAALPVVVRLTVPHEDQAGAGSSHAVGSSSICRSMTGASRHSRSSA